MIFDQKSNSLLNSKCELIKKFDCPLSKKWEMMSTTKSESVRFCSACQKDVIDITPFDELQIIALFKVNISACAYLNLTEYEGELLVINQPERPKTCIEHGVGGLSIIFTARGESEILESQNNGNKIIRVPEYPDAAYLIPTNLNAGSKVFLNDIIEQIITTRIMTRNSQRVEYLSQGEAFWDGKQIIVDRPNLMKICG